MGLKVVKEEGQKAAVAGTGGLAGLCVLDGDAGSMTCWM
jgi:hypothetical protein